MSDNITQVDGAPMCDLCSEELRGRAGIRTTPPTGARVHMPKYHVCLACYALIWEASATTHNV